MARERDDLDDALDGRRDNDPDDDLDDDLDDDDPDDDSDDGDPDDDGKTRKPAKYTPPTEAEWNRAQRALRRARKQAKTLRESRRPAGRTRDRDDRDDRDRTDDRDRRRPVRSRERDDRDNRDDRDRDDRRDDRAVSEVNARVERAELRTAKAEARAALLAAGADADLVDLAVAKIRLSDIEYNDDDEPELADWIDDMQERYPRLFDQGNGRRKADDDEPRASRRRAGSLDAGATSGRSNGRSTKPTKSLGQLAIEAGQRAYGGGGRTGRRR